MFAFISQSNHDTSINAALGELPRKVIIFNTYNSWVSRKNIYKPQNPDPIHEKIINNKNRKQQVEWLRNFCLPQTDQLGQTFGFAGEERVTCSRLSIRGDGRRNRHRVEKKRERNKTSESVPALHHSYCSTFSRAPQNQLRAWNSQEVKKREMQKASWQ